MIIATAKNSDYKNSTIVEQEWNSRNKQQDWK